MHKMAYTSILAAKKFKVFPTGEDLDGATQNPTLNRNPGEVSFKKS